MGWASGWVRVSMSCGVVCVGSRRVSIHSHVVHSTNLSFLFVCVGWMRYGVWLTSPVGGA